MFQEAWGTAAGKKQVEFNDFLEVILEKDLEWAKNGKENRFFTPLFDLLKKNIFLVNPTLFDDNYTVSVSLSSSHHLCSLLSVAFMFMNNAYINNFKAPFLSSFPYLITMLVCLLISDSSSGSTFFLVHHLSTIWA